MTMAINPNMRAPRAEAAPNSPKGVAAAPKATAAGGASVSISSAAQTAAAEAAESPPQTAQEARGNDMQAKRLLAHETAMRKAYA
jgi:hypothetical protein